MAAPLAHFDEDWQDFNEFKPSSDVVDPLDKLNSNVGDSSGLDDFSDLDNSFSGEICSFKSMEDLVHDFDEKLTVCFRNYNTTTENIAPIKPITEDNYLKDDEVWNALTDNYGNVMPVDWKTSHTRSLHLPSLNLTEHEKLDNQSLDLSDDEELREQMDMHSIIVSCINDEPLFTAEQVIEEIEEMMQESPDPEDDESPSQSDLSMLSQDLNALKRSGSNTSYEDRLRQMSVSELTETLEEVEAAIRRYSEELIQALALRDELDYEKEVKNSFISLLIEVQNRQKEHRELLRKKKKIRHTTTTGPNGQRTASTHIPGTYLTTVIPYEKKAGPPSVEDLQILTKILHAMRDDSEKVPALLTDYILKVLCPT
ncbi:fasciculation and elongation protein zeta-2 isoform X3 [Maylandia zebra]|uniref:Fasciculation and elongation protein zeta 2b n=2 Tax=Haplochromini TaxID=319058 RepID=A0A3Q2VLB6_HAPBU|nr:fasciculation and elongation protein zeta-2 isoform X3 [Maylandia zebra]XP_005914355.1 fasciculation and elongation protein zeta-2 isoform X2 [Haplochromis burtoni]XP_025998373.1 fasciculation and elongation protein zeta-2-like isoform X3 [Astatotilapia calliptera]XP_039872781.1 fasciculation and elongation protein zeta-2 isoform X2 [Simochromis diagramma]